MNFDEVADELYSLAPEEFTATRNEREKQAKSGGDKELAARIRKLAKPNVSAWLANRLVREHPEEIQPLLELGEDLRTAMHDRDGARLRELAKTQRLLISALVDEAKQDAGNAGRKVADEAVRGLVDTLRSALADDRAAGELLAGRLTSAVFRSGLEGDDDGDDETPVPRPPARKKSRKSAADNEFADNDSGGSAEEAADDQAGEREVLRRAREVVQAADELVAEAKSADDGARQAVTDAGTEIERLQARIAELEAELESASAAASEAKATARRTGIEVQRAERAAAGARRRLEKLDQG